jgi:hypothetical protein
MPWDWEKPHLQGLTICTCGDEVSVGPPLEASHILEYDKIHCRSEGVLQRRIKHDVSTLRVQEGSRLALQRYSSGDDPFSQFTHYCE